MEAKFAARKLTNSSVRNPTKEQVRDALARTKDDGLLAGERDLTSELAAEKARKNDKDVILMEAANILGDEVELRKSGANLAAR